MTKKTKMLILAGTVAAVVVGGAAYLFMQKQLLSLEQDNIIQTNDIDQAQIKQEEQVQSKSQEVTITASKGKVTLISKDAIEIDDNGVKKNFALTDGVAVLLVDAGKVEKKTIADIKKEDTVSIMTNQADNSILSIQIGKDAGSAF